MEKTTEIWPFSKTVVVYMDKTTLYNCIEGWGGIDENLTNKDLNNVGIHFFDFFILRFCAIQPGIEGR